MHWTLLLSIVGLLLLITGIALLVTGKVYSSKNDNQNATKYYNLGITCLSFGIVMSILFFMFWIRYTIEEEYD